MALVTAETAGHDPLNPRPLAEIYEAIRGKLESDGNRYHPRDGDDGLLNLIKAKIGTQPNTGRARQKTARKN